LLPVFHKLGLPAGHADRNSEGQAMLDWIYDHGAFYHRYFWHIWNNLTPTGYATLLTSVGVFGWIAMKGKKRH
jgi:hypothetical protein